MYTHAAGHARGHAHLVDEVDVTGRVDDVEGKGLARGGRHQQ